MPATDGFEAAATARRLLVPQGWRRAASDAALASGAGLDLCVLGGKGGGKSSFVAALGESLGYGPTRTQLVSMHAEMSARDLWATREVDHEGRTFWKASPLVDAAVNGHMLVLDGCHRVPGEVLAAVLGPLTHDRFAVLPDGRVLSHQGPQEGQEDGVTSVDGVTSGGGGALRAHPDFRIVLVGDGPTANESTGGGSDPLSHSGGSNHPGSAGSHGGRKHRQTSSSPTGLVQEEGVSSWLHPEVLGRMAVVRLPAIEASNQLEQVL